MIAVLRVTAGWLPLSDHGVAARMGDHEQGMTLVKHAFTMIETTEDPSGQADVLLDLAEARFLAGQQALALDALHDAQLRYAIKGNQAGDIRAARIARLVTAGKDPLEPDSLEMDSLEMDPLV